MTWTTADMGDLDGMTVVVTGPSVGGIGYDTALELARHGARVVLAGRSVAKLDEAEAEIRRVVPRADLVQVVLDLSELASVRRAASEIAALGPLHRLINNAGIMATSHGRTVDGLEQQLATNHFGPFLLTGLLLPSLLEAGTSPYGARVVTVASVGHKLAPKAPLADPRVEGRYLRWPTYFQTKLANLLFTYELDRRLRGAALPVRALAAHPGAVNSRLISNGTSFGPLSRIADAAYPLVSQRPAQGAWPSLMAATADLPGGTYVGPSGIGEMQGPPRVVGSTKLSHDQIAQRRLWEISEQTTGISYP
ncbi:oxidoreductase [Nocardioides nematodiphilus]|uniref:oxidoreductase n=1 Tax=Nocardioides nematodiphilus TaxID=2849669 RepID=UPI001CDA0D8E|nr:oxidoreductase [Nocardioides nematodiphilus]MCA1981756.1 SDR family NAD(P)-dependent oxidoreductase [Nocardioides nematodiphilus]